MKQNHFLILILLTFSSEALSQTFSGELTYRTSYKPKKADFNIDRIKMQQIGEESKYLIMDGYYKTSYFKDGRFTYSYTYHHDSKRMYDEQAGKSYITFRDSRKGKSSLIRSRIYRDSVKQIAGYNCFMVERVYPDRIDYTFYAKDLKISFESFKEHAAGDWYNTIKEVNGALSLATISEYADHIEIHEVTKVTPRKVKREEFKLPTDKAVVASSDALDMQVEMEAPVQEAIQCYQQKISEALTKSNANGVTSYIGFIVRADGSTTMFEPYEEDEFGLHNTAIEVLKNCGLKFKPGKIEDKPVDSFLYFPVEFGR